MALSTSSLANPSSLRIEQGPPPRSGRTIQAHTQLPLHTRRLTKSASTNAKSTAARAASPSSPSMRAASTRRFRIAAALVTDSKEAMWIVPMLGGTKGRVYVSIVQGRGWGGMGKNELFSGSERAVVGVGW